MCSFHVGASEPPYLLLLEVRASEEVHTSFSEFYDSIYAKFAQARVEVPRPSRCFLGPIFALQWPQPLVIFLP
jgi:hypothetical protein